MAQFHLDRARMYADDADGALQGLRDEIEEAALEVESLEGQVTALNERIAELESELVEVGA